MSSFVRQLNMYGFRRPKELDQHVYVHPRFVRQNLNSMRQITRIQSKKKVEKEFELDLGVDKFTFEEHESEQISFLRKKLQQQNMKLKEENQKLKQHLQILSHSSKIFSFLPSFHNSFSLQTSFSNCSKPKQVFFEFAQIVKIEEDIVKLEENPNQNRPHQINMQPVGDCPAEMMKKN